MEGNEQVNVAAQNQQSGKVCNGDCFSCSYQQAWLCASVHSRHTMRLAEQMAVQVEKLTNEVTLLHEKVRELEGKLIINEKEGVINPFAAPNQDEKPKQDKKKK